MHTATHGKTRFHFNSDLSGELVIQQIPMKDQSAVEIVRQISIPAQDVIAFALARLAEQREATAEDEEDTDLDRRLAELKTSERPPRDWLEPKHVHEMVNDAHIVLRRSEDYVPPTGDLACHVLALASENKRMRSDLRDLRDVVRAQAELKASPQAETRDVLVDLEECSLEAATRTTRDVARLDARAAAEIRQLRAELAKERNRIGFGDHEDGEYA